MRKLTTQLNSYPPYRYVGNRGKVVRNLWVLDLLLFLLCFDGVESVGISESRVMLFGCLGTKIRR